MLKILLINSFFYSDHKPNQKPKDIVSKLIKNPLPNISNGRTAQFLRSGFLDLNGPVIQDDTLAMTYPQLYNNKYHYLPSFIDSDASHSLMLNRYLTGLNIKNAGKDVFLDYNKNDVVGEKRIFNSHNFNTNNDVTQMSRFLKINGQAFNTDNINKNRNILPNKNTFSVPQNSIINNFNSHPSNLLLNDERNRPRNPLKTEFNSFSNTKDKEKLRNENKNRNVLQKIGHNAPAYNKGKVMKPNLKKSVSVKSFNQSIYKKPPQAFVSKKSSSQNTVGKLRLNLRNDQLKGDYPFNPLVARVDLKQDDYPLVARLFDLRSGMNRNQFGSKNFLNVNNFHPNENTFNPNGNTFHPNGNTIHPNSPYYQNKIFPYQNEQQDFSQYSSLDSFLYPTFMQQHKRFFEPSADHTKNRFSAGFFYAPKKNSDANAFNAKLQNKTNWFSQKEDNYRKRSNAINTWNKKNESSIVFRSSLNQKHVPFNGNLVSNIRFAKPRLDTLRYNATSMRMTSNHDRPYYAGSLFVGDGFIFDELKSQGDKKRNKLILRNKQFNNDRIFRARYKYLQEAADENKKHSPSLFHKVNKKVITSINSDLKSIAQKIKFYINSFPNNFTNFGIPKKLNSFKDYISSNLLNITILTPEDKSLLMEVFNHTNTVVGMNASNYFKNGVLVAANRPISILKSTAVNNESSPLSMINSKNFIKAIKVLSSSFVQSKFSNQTDRPVAVTKPISKNNFFDRFQKSEKITSIKHFSNGSSSPKDPLLAATFENLTQATENTNASSSLVKGISNEFNGMLLLSSSIDLKQLDTNICAQTLKIRLLIAF